MFNSIRWSAKRRRSGRTSDRPAECASSNSFLSCIHAMTRVGGGEIAESRPAVPPVAYIGFARTTENGSGEELGSEETGKLCRGYIRSRDTSGP
jgi:hypothetical protein